MGGSRRARSQNNSLRSRCTAIASATSRRARYCSREKGAWWWWWWLLDETDITGHSQGSHPPILPGSSAGVVVSRWPQRGRGRAVGLSPFAPRKGVHCRLSLRERTCVHSLTHALSRSERRQSNSTGGRKQGSKRRQK